MHSNHSLESKWCKYKNQRIYVHHGTNRVPETSCVGPVKPLLDLPFCSFQCNKSLLWLGLFDHIHKDCLSKEQLTRHVKKLVIIGLNMLTFQ